MGKGLAQAPEGRPGPGVRTKGVTGLAQVPFLVVLGFAFLLFFPFFLFVVFSFVSLESSGAAGSVHWAHAGRPGGLKGTIAKG